MKNENKIVLTEYKTKEEFLKDIRELKKLGVINVDEYLSERKTQKDLLPYLRVLARIILTIGDYHYNTDMKAVSVLAESLKEVFPSFEDASKIIAAFPARDNGIKQTTISGSFKILANATKGDCLEYETQRMHPWEEGEGAIIYHLNKIDRENEYAYEIPQQKPQFINELEAQTL